MKRAILLLSCVILALTAPQALAKKNHKKKSQGLGPVVTVTATGATVSSAGTISSASATCPSGLQAVGGGYAAPLKPGNVMLVIDSYRSGPGTWTVDGISGTGTSATTAYAYCRKSTFPVTDFATSASLPSGAGQTASTAASCPAGSQLVSGGFQATNTPGTNEFAFPTTNMSTAPGTWSLVMINNVGGAKTMTVHAYCLRGIKTPLVLNTTSSLTLDSGASASLSAPACPAPKKVKKKGKKKKRKPAQLLTSGGFQSPAPPRTTIAIFIESRTTGASWSGTAVNLAAPGTITLTVQGICV
jgi:hypothetical protein